MKNKLWLFQIPIVILFTLAFYVDEMGVQGALQNGFLREHVRPTLRRFSDLLTDTKFRVRGPEPAKNKIVVVAIDNQSIEAVGRWPWHRDFTAALINSIFEAGAKAVALDMVFSEPDPRVHPDLAKFLADKGMGDLTEKFDTDRVLMQEIRNQSDRLVLGWTTDTRCQPAYEKPECTPTNPEAVATHPADYQKFAYTQFNAPYGFDAEKTPFISLLTFIPNLPEYNAMAKHSGYFNVEPDNDGHVRRMNLFIMANGKPYPGLALELARIGLNDDLQVTLDEKQLVKSLGFVKSGRNIPVSPLGVIEINMRGPGKTFPHISAFDMLTDKDTVAGDAITGQDVNAKKKDIFKDALVLIGPTAIGIYDMRATSFDSNIAGVEVHANILDNLLSGDTLTSTSMSHGTVWVLLLMIAGALLWAYAAARLEAIPALVMFVVTFAIAGWVDLNLLFKKGQNWNTVFLYLEMLTIFIVTLALKYVLEERNKKFIRGAFTKYVAPAVVDSILKDPTKLTVGGEKRELTILFSDIRGFTSFSERMDAKVLSSLLNDYLGTMTKIVFSHEGTLDKYIGDAIMAFWGAPLDQPKHAANAAKAAVAMIQALEQHRPRIKEQYGVNIEIGVGINSGTVSVGNMGSDTNFAYTVIGDRVNLASRLEGLTKEYGVTILTTRYTFDDIAGCGEPLPPHRILDHVKVKGKKEAVELIQILDRTMAEEGLKLFQSGRDFYAAQKWDEAIEAFGKANELLAPSVEKMDGPCKEFLKRCADFKVEPPGPAWDGSWEMHTK